MTVNLTPNSEGEPEGLEEYNHCHGEADGKFCSTGEATGGKKYIGTLARYGWKPGVHKNPGGARGVDKPYLVVTPDETHGVDSRREGQRLFAQLTGQAATGKRGVTSKSAADFWTDVHTRNVLRKAGDDWAENRAYLDNRGNYHVRPEKATPTHHRKGPIAPWNKLVKKVFSTHERFSNFAVRRPVHWSEMGRSRHVARRSTSSGLL